jgi:2',3'-cyclic-nucleotide 2'-phosphodiesterase / 3'-nucleotidase / 5'-nucleotidase
MKNKLLAAMLITVFLFSMMGTNVVAAAETRNIVVLATSDIHGNVRNYDYFTDAAPSTSSGRGLTKVYTYVKNALLANPDTILVDNGDIIQGTPLSYYFDMLDTSVENPMALAMNTMGYVSATVGNHEFNYGPTVFNKYQDDANFPMLAANVTGCQDYKFEPYTIKTMDGVDVGILGLTPPAVPHWERPENIVGCVFGDAIAAAANYVPLMRAAGADVIVVTAHSGIDETYGYGLAEDFVPTLANTVPGIDVIVAGHAHSTIASQIINGVLVTEPNYQASRVSNIKISLTGSGSDWTVSTKSSTVDQVNTFAEDPTLLGLMMPYHNATVAYINTPIGTATDAFPGGNAARIADGPMADLINRVQMDSAAAAGFPVQASLAALFNDNAKLNAGAIKLKDAYAVYIYDNTLYVVDATGQQIKNELEWTASYFNQYYYDPAGVTGGTMPAYNYDLWAGIDYKIDVTKPVGQRVVELNLNGTPIAMDQTVRIALNNYRATGQFKDAPRLYQSTTEVRQLITDWISARGTISPADVFVQNYTLLPPVNTWLSTMTASPVSRSDFADLTWTAFDGNRDDYMKIPSDKGPAGATLNREGAVWLLGDKAMTDLRPDTMDMSLLNAYTDKGKLSAWAKNPMSYALSMGIFMPAGNQLLPQQILTNSEALALLREARYPLYTFLSTNDFHGQLETGKLVSNKPVGGAAYNMTYINNYRALNPKGTLLMDGGDMMQGMPISNLMQGSSVMDVFNHIGYMASVTGNHEFDWDQNVLRTRMTQAQFPILAANIFLAGTNARPDWAVPTAMFTVKGQQIGVIGVTSKDTPTIVMAGNVAGLEFRPVGPIVQQFITELRAQGADIVVVLAHMPDVYGGVVSGEMAAVAVPGVDLIISGHSHSGYSGMINNIPITQAYSSGTAVGVSDLRYDRLLHNIASSKLQVVTTYNAGITPDKEIAALVADYQAKIAPTVTALKAKTLGMISRTTNAAGESPMGNLIADAQRWKSGTQIAFMNPGGIRADIAFTSYPHDVTWGDFFTVQPFDNKMVTMTMTGSQIYQLLEQQFPPTQTSNKILLVSGIKYSYNLALPVGSRITSLTLAGGTPIPNDATIYTVAMNNYLATGGDKFSAFLSGTNVNYIGVSDLDALIDYVLYKYGTPSNNTPIDPTEYPVIEGRIIKQ